MTETYEASFESTLTDSMCEYAYGLAKWAQEHDWHSFTEVGMRAARARDPRLLKALERMAESTSKLEENQMGRMKRDAGSTFGESRGTTEHQLCREAYRMVDQGTPVPHLCYIYGSAAWLCGYIRPPSRGVLPPHGA